MTSPCKAESFSHTEAPVNPATKAMAIAVGLASSQDREDWNQFVENSPKAEIYHLYEWSELFAEVFGNDSRYLLARDGSGAVCGLLPLVHLNSRLFGNFLVSVPCFNYCGVLAYNISAAKALLQAAVEVAGDLGADHVELRHRDQFDCDLPYRSDKVSMQLDLPESVEALWTSFSPKLRAQIRRPQKEGAECICGSLELLDAFYAVFSENMRDLGTPVYPKALFRQMCERFPDSTRIFVVNLHGRHVAAGITLGFRTTMEIPSASSLREFNRYSVNMLLYWAILQSAIENGFTKFDFGRSSVNSGTHRFKQQWGASAQPLQWHYCLSDGKDIPMLNPDNPKFRLATRIWRRLPLKVANFIGPRIVRNLP